VERAQVQPQLRKPIKSMEQVLLAKGVEKEVLGQIMFIGFNPQVREIVWHNTEYIYSSIFLRFFFQLNTFFILNLDNIFCFFLC